MNPNRCDTTVALQLYTLRNALERDFPGTLQQIADIGYTHVETAFWPAHISVTEASGLLRGLGLNVCAVHCELPLDDQARPVLEMMATFGCDRMIWHGWPQDPDYRSLDGIKRLAARYNAANAVAQANGLRLGIHNHWWEFEPVAGRYPYQVLLEEMDERIFFEVDTYWVKTAGVDPVAVVTELGDRAPLLHIKDGPAVKGAPMVAAGDGTQDIPAIIQASAGRAEWLIVELDECATDMVTAVRRSYDYLTALV